MQIVNQLVGIGIGVSLAVVGALVILKVVNLVLGQRVSETQVIAGLDATQHGETAYVFEGEPFHISGQNSIRQTNNFQNDLISSQLALETD